MRSGVHKIIRKAFKEKEKLTIHEIYEIVATGLGEPNSKVLQHTVRGAIHNLKKNNRILQIGPGYYGISETT